MSDSLKMGTAAPATTTTTPHPVDGSWALRARIWQRSASRAQAAIWPLVDVALRLWLAAIFTGYVAGVWTMGGLAAVDAASLVASGILLLAAASLAFGLFTRLATLPLLVEAASTTLATAAAEPLHCTLLLLWFLVAGSGSLSIDAVLRPGAARSALPGRAQGAELARRIADQGEPVVLLLFRLALVAVLIGWLPVGVLASLGDWQPLASLAAWPVAAASLALLLATGLLLRPVALGLIIWTTTLAILGTGAASDLYALSLLAVLLCRGGGAYGLDRVVAARMAPALAPAAWDDADLPHVVVVGAGFGGLAVVDHLHDARCRITLVDRRNYHLFQPLLYQVATCGLSPADIATPIRELVRDQPNVRTILGRVTDVDLDAKRVRIGEDVLDYDTLVLATGARHAYFGNDHFEAVAPGLKKIDDATDIRRRLLLAFERAEQTTDPAERAAQLTFVVIGGGPTGVEMAGAMAELAHHGLAGEFRNLQPEEARVILLEGGPRVLATFPEQLSAFTRASLEALGVEVRTGARALDIDPAGVTLEDGRIDTRTVVWGAGVMASPAGKWLGAEQDRAGRVVVDDRLQVPGRDDVFVIGDTASVQGPDGRPVPGIAPAAKQQGAYVARAIKARLCGKPRPGPFAYRHQGSLATIGRAAAVVDLGRVRLTGALAWWFWGLVHVVFLAHVRHRVAVSLQWAWAYLTWRKSTRLITGHEG